jgi:two-component system CheB/CheR fusion protein
VDSEKTFPVVGIGSSAGGVEALRMLFDKMPADTGMAFILVPHLAPDQESLLTEILRRHTSMPVHTAANGGEIAANALYVCPPNHVLTIEDAHLRLTRHTEIRQRKPIDVFLNSLADAYAAAAVGILLSGSDADGTLGIKAIKEAGGLTVAQGADGTAPLHAEMPNAAIAAGVIDIIAPLDDIASRIADYARNFGALEAKVSHDSEKLESGAADGYQPIFRLLLNQVGHDFSGYKERTFARRVRRRMQVLQIEQLEDYIDRLKKEPEEVSLLFRDLLISVTNFFRDPDAFETLAQDVIPEIMNGKGVADTVRIWVPGCATGEEVYSIAILMREYLETMRNAPKLQLFATDIDEPALAVARAARYPAQLLEHVSPERLAKYFVGGDGGYVVAKSIRDLCLFSSHSVIRDPPFSRLDMISCRNLLIYLGVEFQNQVIPVFHFALRPGGYLFLGTSENVTQHGDLFSPLDKKHRIFQRRDNAVTGLQLPFFTPRGRGFPVTAESRKDPAGTIANLRRNVETRVMERFAPPHVVINSEGDILHFSARTGRYLEPASGLPNRQLLSMARRGLRLDLRAALREAVETRRRVERPNIEVDDDSKSFFVNLTVEPLGADADPLFLVLFDDVAAAAPLIGATRKLAEGDDAHYEQLEHELRDTRERLQSTIEEYETAVEELKSSNEELQSINEELQSTNEELETSKEELQSVNEELHTVNSELNTKVIEVDRAHSDLRNIFDSTQIATVFLDTKLVIRSFTPAMTDIFNLIPSDHGRPLTDIVSRLDTSGLARDMQSVLQRGEIVERKVQRTDGEAEYLMRILPYRGRKQVIDGILVTFIDISRLSAAEAQQRVMSDELNSRVQTMLTTVNELGKRALAQTSGPKEFAVQFADRIKAVGTAYNVVAQAGWKPVPLREIISAQIKGGGSDRIELEGPELFAKPRMVLSLGLIVHELCSNAARHGSLSRPQGHVKIQWSIEGQSEPQVILRWTEAGGPPAKEPKKTGDGATLINKEVKQTLGGRVSLAFTKTGLVAELALPLEPNFRTER